MRISFIQKSNSVFLNFEDKFLIVKNSLDFKIMKVSKEFMYSNNLESSEQFCFFCGKEQIPSGKLENGTFHCNSCGKEQSHFNSNYWIKNISNELLEILDVQISFQEILRITFYLIQKKLNISSCAYYSFNQENNFLQLEDYQIHFKTLRAFRNIRVSLEETENPIIKCFLSKQEQWVELELYKKYKFRIYKILKKFQDTNYYFHYPICFKNTCIGVFVIEFTHEEEVNQFKKKISIYYFILKIFAYAIHNQSLYNRYKTKYEQFQNLHSSGLTLNKLYLNNTQEIIRMTLLTMGGLTNTNLNLLVIYNKKYQALTINKLIKDDYGIDLTYQNYSLEEYPDIVEYFATKEPKIFERKKIPIAIKFGFTGVHALVLPSFEIAENIYCFILGRNSRKLFTKDEIEILQAYSDLVRITIDNSLMYHGLAKQERLEKELEIARDIQMNLLPRQIPISEDYEFAGFMIPAREIGGDYYDFMQSPNGKETLIAIGDVSGKGIPAGMVMATARTIIHSLVRKKTSFNEILPEVNAYLYHNYKNSIVTRFMSLILLKIQNQNPLIQFRGAGHGSFIIYRSQKKKVEIVESGGMVLGIAPEIPYTKGKIHLKSGDSILLYTDGVTEAQNSKMELFEEERLIESFQKHAEKPCKETLNSIYEDIKNFTRNASQNDDITLVCIKKK